MASLGPNIILLAMLLGPVTGTPAELTALVDPADYFASRRINVGVASLLELASASPTDAKGTFQQLLAIRWLGENRDRHGEHQEAVRRALDRLARGPDGFARDQAQLALARIDGRPTPVLHAAPKDSLREALAWFPQGVSLAVALDARPPAGQRPDAQPDPDLERRVRHMPPLLLKGMPGQFREELYGMGEAVGNFRLDRFALGFAPDAEGSDKGRMFVRGTGRMDHKRLAAFFRDKAGRDSVVEKKGLRGEAITVLHQENNPPAVVLVGDSDVIITGYVGDSVNSAGLAEEVLAVREGGRPGLLAGPLGKTLRDLPPDVRGVLRGTLPREWAVPLARSSFGAAPQQVAVDLLFPGTSQAALDIRGRGTFDSEADAAKFAAALHGEVKQVAEALKEQPLPLQLGGVATIRKTVEAIEVKADGPAVTAKATVPAATLRALLGLAEMALRSGPGRPTDGG
jgi:hypothetical protein